MAEDFLTEADPREIWAARKLRVESYQSAWRGQASLAEELYELRWQMDGIPDNIPITMPSTARAIVDEATDHSDFDPRWVKVHTPTYGLSEKAAQESSRLRAFFPGWLYYQMTHANDVSPIRDFLKNLYIYGKAVFKVYWARDEWPEIEYFEDMTEGQRKKAEKAVKKNREFSMPIIMRSVHPLALIEDPTNGAKKWAIEVYEHAPMEVVDLYEEWIPTRLTSDDILDPNLTVQVMDCYERGIEDGVQGTYHQVFIDEGEGVVSPATERAFLANQPFPYIVKFSGLGRQSGGKYEEKARGLLYAVDSLLRAEGRRLTQLDHIISAMAWPTLFVTGPRSKFRVAYGPNVVNYIPQGVQVTTVTPNIPAGPIQAGLATLQAGIERGTFGSVIRGEKPPQTTSAAQLAILSGQARLRFGAPKIHIEAALMEVFQKVSIIAKHAIDDDLTLWQWDDTDAESPNKLVLKPSDIPDPFVCHVEVMADPIEEQERRAQFGVFLFEKGIIDWEEAAERAGVRDVSAMRRRIIRDKILFETPAVIQALGEQYILESGYDIESLTLEKAMRDMLILRGQREMQEAIMSDMGGAASSPGSTAANDQGFSPNQLGGRPEAAPTPGQASMDGMASA